MSEEIEENSNQKLEGGAYEIIRKRLLKNGTEFKRKLDELNSHRRELFGSIETVLLTTERITTENNCQPRDIISLGKDLFLFGYNVHIGLRSETHVKDVFSYYKFDPKSHEFTESVSGMLEDEQFLTDFANLYKYYRETTFSKFAQMGPYLYMVFRIGKGENDIKVFKWLNDGDVCEYEGNRFDHEYKFPTQHQFDWKTVSRDDHVSGTHPHISIEDKVFVETVGGDLTIKIENNTESGKGIYAEKVDSADQTLDDADIKYAIVGNLILLKIRPYQEKDYRHLVFNQKMQEVVRIDAINDSCILLPGDQGIIFPKGYYINTGEFKLFDSQFEDMLFEKKIPSSNGEDFLFVFYNRLSGVYILLSYNIISQKVENPIICNGYTLFDNGELALFKSHEDMQKHHPIQIWQTTYSKEEKKVAAHKDSYLAKVGNKEVVRALSECHELIKLIDKEDSFSKLYIDRVKNSTDIVDTYHWISNKEASNLDVELLEIKKTASNAIDEFDKVIKLKKYALEIIHETEKKAKNLLSRAKNLRVAKVNDFVHLIAELRDLKGELISLNNVRYIDLNKIKQLETSINQAFDFASENCVNFLLKDEALDPYNEKVTSVKKELAGLNKVIIANDLEKEINGLSDELELLIEIVSNLKILDATKTTEIIDKITDLFSKFNQLKSALRKKRKELMLVEGKAEFNAQIRLIEQGFINYIDISDSPEKCDEYLNKLVIQLEDLEGKFSEFEEYIELITDKREDIYNAFENKKVTLVEANNKKIESIYSSALRILNGIKNKAGSFKTVLEINGYFASDLMVDKVRDSINKLIELKDANKADDIQSQLNAQKEEVLRQLKDKLELFTGGENLIKFGNHEFLVNTLKLDVATVFRKDSIYYHLTGTNFYEEIQSPELMDFEPYWNQTLVSENENVYRAEFLAFHFFNSISTSHNTFLEWGKTTESERLEALQVFMSKRFNEGYVKGIHDMDALKIVNELTLKHELIHNLKYSAPDRVSAILFWEFGIENKQKEAFFHSIKAVGALNTVFPNHKESVYLKTQLVDLINGFDFDLSITVKEQAIDYLVDELSQSDTYVLSHEANLLHTAFNGFLKSNQKVKVFNSVVGSDNFDWKQKFHQISLWLESFIDDNQFQTSTNAILETVVYILLNAPKKYYNSNVDLAIKLTDLNGEHNTLEDNTYTTNYNEFTSRLHNFETTDVLSYRAYNDLKTKLISDFKEEIRINEFKPRVLSSFVRNKLIDQVYLSMVGDNFAKQIGAAGSTKRTDLMGLLLLISPPGYGKTTLMEYIANRLGLIFMKINGPAIGHDVTSLDPAEAGNATAREELLKLNLALEMGDNIMLYLDDIQHCNPELLQKFISLCDAQRKIEGVYKGKTKTYDFKGKKVAVVMAGNPYTESGDKFQIPDMLANRADIYNLGDILGDSDAEFKLSYIENSLTSNVILGRLADKSKNDIYNLIKVAEGTPLQDVELEQAFSSEDISDVTNLLKKAIYVRDILLTVNLEYIDSAGREDSYRTEPSFKLQGSYRDMNKLVEKLNPLMNQQELETLIVSHYENESQTLTTGAEANLLKFKLMNNLISKEEQVRWDEILKEFSRQQKLKGFGSNDMANIVSQMETINITLGGINKQETDPKFVEQIKTLSEGVQAISEVLKSKQ
jgi:hypothetical protein